MNQSVSILLVGCGKMGGAVLNGALQNGFSPEHIFVVEPNNDIRKVLKDKKIVSAPSYSFLFASAIWNSYSKSETARSPLTIAQSPSRRR